MFGLVKWKTESRKESKKVDILYRQIIAWFISIWESWTYGSYGPEYIINWNQYHYSVQLL